MRYLPSPMPEFNASKNVPITLILPQDEKPNTKIELPEKIILTRGNIAFPLTNFKNTPK